MRVQEAPKRVRVIEAFSHLAVGISCCLSAVMFIEWAPKPESSRNTLRLLYVCVYFAAWLGLVHHLRRSAPTFLWQLTRWRFESSPPSMEKAWKSMLEETEFLLVTICWTWLVFIGCTGLLVLISWFNVPALIQACMHMFWWLAVLSLVGVAYFLPASLVSIMRQYRFLRRQIDTCDFYQPRPLSHLWQLSPDAADMCVRPKQPRGGFLAGHRAWKFSRLTENVIILGSVGSGKTACVMNAFLDELVGARALKLPTGGLVLDFKGDYYSKIERLSAKHNRQADLVVLSPESGHIWNPLDTDEPAREVAARFVAAMKALGQQDNNTSFFADQAETFLENAISLLRLTASASLPPTIHDIYSLANDRDYLDRKFRRLSQPNELAPRSSPHVRCYRYFAYEFSSLPEETRQSVLATLNNMLNPLCGEHVTQLIDGSSTIKLADVTQSSKILYLHLPSSQTPKAGRVLGLLLKLAYFAEVKKKQLDTDRYTFFFCDEFQEFYTSDTDSSDARFFAVSRQYMHINLVATQNINNFTMQGERREAVMSMLANIKTKIFLRNSDKDTNDYASALFGQYVMELGAGHMAAQAQLAAVVQPSDFIMLKTPEKGVRKYCESYVLNESESKVDLASRSCRWRLHLI